MDDLDLILANDFMLFIEVIRDNNTLMLPLCAATNVTIEGTNDIKEATPNPIKTSSDYGWRSYYYGFSSYTLSIDGLVNITSNKKIQDMVLGYLGNEFDAGDGVNVLGYGRQIDADSRASYFDIENLFMSKSRLRWVATFDDGGNYIKYAGYALVPSFSHQSQSGDVNRFSVPLQGVGKLEVYQSLPVASLAITSAKSTYLPVASGGSYTEVVYNFYDSSLSSLYDVQLIGWDTGNVYTKTITGSQDGNVSDTFHVNSIADTYYTLKVAKKLPKRSEWATADTSVESTVVPITNIRIDSISYTGGKCWVVIAWDDDGDGTLWDTKLTTSEGVEGTGNNRNTRTSYLSVADPHYTDSDPKVWTVGVKRTSPTQTDFYYLNFNVQSNLDVRSLAAVVTAARLNVSIYITFSSSGSIFNLKLANDSGYSVENTITKGTGYNWVIPASGMVSGDYTLTVTQIQPASTNSTSIPLQITIPY